MNRLRIIFFSIIFSVLFFVNGVQGQVTEQIVAYDVDLTVHQEGVVQVTEKILYDFGQEQRRGIIRTIPLRYSGDGNGFVTPIHINHITNEKGEGYLFSQRKDEDVVYVRIGDPDTYISGQHWYYISYTVEGVLAQYPNHIELYWNAIGTEWQIPIQTSRVRVFVPFDSVVQEPLMADCYTGGYLTQLKNCNVTAVSESEYVYEMTHPLNPFEGFTILLGMKVGSVYVPSELAVLSTPQAHIFIDNEYRHITPFFTRISPGHYDITLQAFKYYDVSDTVTLAQGESVVREYVMTKSFFGYFVEYGVPVVWFLVVSGGMGALWLWRGRDPQGRGTVIAQYEAPHNMTPGEVGVLYDDTLHIHDITAGIVHLAVRGYLMIEKNNNDTAQWYESKKPTFTLVKKKEPQLTDPMISTFEVLLFEKIFKKADTVPLKSLENTFYVHLPELKDILIANVVERGYYSQDPQKVKRKWIAGVVIVMAALLFGIFDVAIAWDAPFLVVAHGLSTLVCIVIAFYMHRRTAEGARVYEEVLGLREFIKVTTQDRIKALYSPQNFQDLFEKLLPYAMVFGLEKEWGEHFEGLFETPPQWYEGTGSFSPVQFSALMHAFNTTSQQTLASAPSSSGSSSGGWSGGSGFSSGGGFSGGGFGGGGGSSW